MPDPYKKSAPGERLVIPATAWNKMLDMISVPQQTGGELGSLDIAPNLVWVKNVSGSDAYRFNVLSISGVVIDPIDGETQEKDFARRPVVKGTKDNTGYAFVILLEDIKSNAIGRAAASGVVACKVNVSNPAHKYARPNGLGTLESSVCGPVHLLWLGITGPTGASTTGPGKWAVGVL